VVGMSMAPVGAQDTPPSAPPGGGTPPPPPPPKKSLSERLYFGGNVGVSFGDVTYVDVSPYMGIDLGHNWSGGLGVFYRYRDDERYEPNLSTSDYGASVFARYRPVPPLYLHAEYSWTDFEYPLLGGGTARDDYTAVLLGGGFVKPLGGRSAFIVQALYDVSWSDDDPTPYDSPWLISAGVSVGF
jgi:hypothetical protein